MSLGQACHAFCPFQPPTAIVEPRQQTLRCSVEVEEVVTDYAAANNGAGPLWCYGSTVIARLGDDVFLSVIETGKNIPLLCNTRWQLWHRSDAGWNIAQQEENYRQREPCPIAVSPAGRVLLSVNPSTEPPGTQYGPCRPEVLEFDADEASALPKTHLPSWSSKAYFTDHSYRGFAADRDKGEILLVNIDARTGEQFVSYCDSTGNWHPAGAVTFPIRSCYPQVALHNRSAHIMAIGDIVEPVEKWRKLKFEKLNSQWDYVFRRLFYTFTPDVAAEPFSAVVEIDSVEDTCGHIQNLDMHVDAAGDAHLLYLKRPFQHTFIRDEYFPGRPMTSHLEYVVVREGRVIRRQTLVETPQNNKGIEPSFARFHVASDDRLFAVLAGTAINDGQGKFANWVMPVQAREASARPVPLALEHPFRSFFTNTPRGGSQPSDIADLFGIADDNPNLRYARIRIDAAAFGGR